MRPCGLLIGRSPVRRSGVLREPCGCKGAASLRATPILCSLRPKLALRCRSWPKLSLRCGVLWDPHLSVSIGRKSHLSGCFGHGLRLQAPQRAKRRRFRAKLGEGVALDVLPLLVEAPVHRALSDVEHHGHNRGARSLRCCLQHGKAVGDIEAGLGLFQ